VIGIQIFGLTVLFMLSNIIGNLLFKVAYPTVNGLFEDIREDNITSTLVASAIIFSIGYSSSYFVLRPFILDWVSKNAGLIPLN
jgi:Sec-independent protein secretion pathway component TatC